MVHDDAAASSDFAAEVDQNIARNLRRTREAYGWSQAEFADRVRALGVPGIHQTTVARMENAQRPLRAAEAIVICRLLEVSLERLAESGVSADLRSDISELTQSAALFDSSARRLLHARRLVAIAQDGKYPYGPDGRAAHDQVIRSGVDPALYELLEERLASSAPHEHLEIIYNNDLHDESAYARPVSSEHKSRVEFIAEEMNDWLTRGDGDDIRTVGEDYDDLLRRVEPETDDGVDQATP